LTLKDSWSPESQALKVGEPVTRTIMLMAKDIQSAQLPDLNLSTPNNMNAYPDQAQSKDFLSSKGPAAEKIFKVAYVPTAAGEVTFPAVKVRWWSVLKNKEETAILPAKQFKVFPGVAPVPRATSMPGASPVITQQTLTKTVYSQFWQYVSAVLALLLLLILFVLFVVLKRSKRNSPVESAPEVKTSSAPGEHKLLVAVKETCKKQDLTQVNLAIIKWASAHWSDANVYTVRDVAKLAASDDLKSSLEALNLALYAQGSFKNYDALWQAVRGEIRTKKASSDKGQQIKPLYPK